MIKFFVFFFFFSPLLQNSHYQTKPISLFLSEAGQDFNVFLDYLLCLVYTCSNFKNTKAMVKNIVFTV